MTGRGSPLPAPNLDALRPAGMRVEVIVPVFNEEGILESQLVPILEVLPPGFHLSVIENGSTDRTVAILDTLEERFPALLSHRSLPLPNYGLAMREGLRAATGEIIIVDDLDVLDMDFWGRGLAILAEGSADIVQGSKVLAGREDRRPILRRAATLTLTFLLRALLGFRGTDTHGPKVMFRTAIARVLPECTFELDLFPTELVIRAQRSGVRIREIPIHLREIRATPLPLLKRVPRAVRDIWRLRRTLGGRAAGRKPV
jgi:glycosyltransferase involved in cell wall biosynthesis